MSKDVRDYYISRGKEESRDIEAIFEFLREDFNSIVTYNEEEIDNILHTAKTIKNIVYVGWQIDKFKSDFGGFGRLPMKVVFMFSDDTKLEYDCSINISQYTVDLKLPILRTLRKNVQKDEIYNKIHSVKIGEGAEIIPKEILHSLEDSLSQNPNSIFGIYKLISSTKFSSLSKIGVFLRNDSILIVNLENSAFADDWKVGQIIGKLEKTASSKYFIGYYKGIVGEKEEISVLYDDNIIELSFIKDKSVRKFIKIK